MEDDSDDLAGAVAPLSRIGLLMSVDLSVQYTS